MRFLIAVPSAVVLISIASVPARCAETRQAAAAIDATKTGAQISKNIYGQFIEHLGRCIYGGLWAEMLKDRKFYYPVTGEAPAWVMFEPGTPSWEGEGHPYELLERSPWMIVGEKGAVTMAKDGAFVGEHSPEVTLTGDNKPVGVMQERLGLEAERAYTGRIVLAGDSSAAPISVSLVWGGGASDRDTVVIDELNGAFATHQLLFQSSGTTDNGRIEIVGRGSGRFRIGAVSLMPADNVDGWRSDTLALLKQLDSPVYRWPGGNFVSGYDWKDGVGDRDRRPPRKNPAWKGVEPNDVGIHEFMDLCREIGAEPYIAVNTGLGGAGAAAQQVEYVNGADDTAMGRLRAENGHSKPFGVKLWAVGNEMYGDWQLGHMPLEDYIKKHVQVVDAMRAVDPSIQPVAVGALGDWSRTMLSQAASHMSLISEHIYWQDKDDLVEHVAQIRDGIRRIAEAHRAYRKELPALQGKDIRIALDEWNYWYGPFEFGELGVRYFMQDALGIAAGLHELFRNSDIFAMANYAQTVNVIGAIKTTKTRAEMEATGLVLALYRRRFGEVPLAVSGEHAPLDIAAARSGDGSALKVAVVNPTEERWSVSLAVKGAEPVGKTRRWVLAGPTRWAFNSPGRERSVDIHHTSQDDFSETLDVAPLSVALFSIAVR
jgi:alpha-N-arabinofuranosidase